jgi:hypothetical protein
MYECMGNYLGSLEVVYGVTSSSVACEDGNRAIGSLQIYTITMGYK